MLAPKAKICREFDRDESHTLGIGWQAGRGAWVNAKMVTNTGICVNSLEKFDRNESHALGIS